MCYILHNYECLNIIIYMDICVAIFAQQTRDNFGTDHKIYIINVCMYV